MKISQQTKKRGSKKSAKKNEKRDNRIFGRSMQGRLALTFGVITVALFALSIVLIRINAGKGEQYSKTVLSQQDYSSTVVPFRRGMITDRNQTVLATSERVYNLILDPKVILTNDGVNKDATLEALVQCYHYDRAELEQILADKAESSYVRYQRQLSEEEHELFLNYQSEYNAEAAKTNDAKIVGVWFESEYKRVYPMNELACTLLGFSASDSSRGNWGIEEYYNDELTGVNGREYGYMDTDGSPDREVKQAIDGNTIVSTVDYTIQGYAEQFIQEFLKNHTADNVGVLVMDPNNGEILAMATDKSYDLNNPTDLSEYYTEDEQAAMTEQELSEARAQIWRNFAVQDAYEPGSTSKPVTVAAGLEENLIHPTDTYLCEGEKIFGSGSYETTVHCNDVHNTVNLQQALMYSCNVAMMDIGATLGNETFSKYLNLFGFGKQTNIDLPGESAGLLIDPANMGVTDLATNAFGQNYNVTMVQLASALCSIINGGSYYQPHVVKQILNADGEILKNVEPVLVRETVSQSTSDFIKEALFQTVENGTGQAAKIAGYSIGGKTGTAQKHPRSEGKYLVSFVGFAPAEAPQVLVYVIVDNPTVSEDESVSAGLAIKIEKMVMESIIPYMNIPYSSDTEPETTTIAEETSATEASTDSEGNMIPASASASFNEVVPSAGYLNDPTESGESRTVSGSENSPPEDGTLAESSSAEETMNPEDTLPAEE